MYAVQTAMDTTVSEALLLLYCIQAAYNKHDDRIRIRDTTILKYLSFYAGGYSRIPFMYRVGTVYIIQIKHIEK